MTTEMIPRETAGISRSTISGRTPSSAAIPRGSTMPGVVQALEFLGRKAGEVPPVCVLFGDEAFLKQESLDALRAAVLGDDEGEFSLTSFVGDDVEMHQVFDCLSTVALFGAGKRLV